MKPRLGDRIVDPDGRVTRDDQPDEEERVMSERAAAELAEMMANVVQRGHGHGGRAPGHRGGGQDRHRRGGRRDGEPGVVHRVRAGADPQVAIAVTVERTRVRAATVAAPIAEGSRSLESAGPMAEVATRDDRRRPLPRS